MYWGQPARIFFLNINTDKTKLTVFRKGGFLDEKWSIDDKTLEVVSEYTYLGSTFTTKRSVAKGVDVLAAKGKQACVESVRYLGRLSEMSKNGFFRIFDTQVQPVLLYSAEIWGLHRGKNAGHVMSETYRFALDLGTSGCSKVSGVKQLSSFWKTHWYI